MSTRIVLLPGMDGTGSLFGPLVERTPPAFDARVVTYPRDVGEVSELARRAAEAIPSDRPFVLVAESFSGPIALTLAARRPVGLRAVVLCATFVTNPVPWFPAALASMVRSPVFAMTPSVLVEASLLGTQGDADLRARVREAIAGVPADVLAQRARACLRADARAALVSCPAPILILRATQDLVVPASCTREIVEARPDAILREIAAPHLLLQVAPEAAWMEIERFVAGLP